MRGVLLVVALVVASARGADTPLSAILIEGEGWKSAEGSPVQRPSRPYFTAKAGNGFGLYSHKDAPPLVVALPGERFGAVALSPKRGQLVLAVPSHHYLYAFQIGNDGKLVAGERTYSLRPEGTGRAGSNVGTLAFDMKGRLFAAMPGGVQFFDEEMRFSGQLSRPERQPVTHVWFGGDKNDELFILCGGRTWKRKVKAVGAK
jgi:hypothetical protein